MIEAISDLDEPLARQVLEDFQLKRSINDFGYFIDKVLRIVEYVNQYNPKHRVQSLNWHQLEWIEFLETEKRIAIMAPRDHWKSSIFSVAYPLWRLLRGERGYLISNSLDQAIKILERIKWIIADRPILHFLKAKNPEIWHKTEIQCTNRGTLVAKGFGSAMRGAHPHFIVVDDPLSERMPFSMEFVKDHFRRGITNMCIEGGTIALVGTPLRYDDLLMETIEYNTEYYRRTYQAILNWDEQKVLFPEFYSWERLMQKRREIGSLAFDQEFMCSPLDESSSLFPWTLLQTCLDYDATLLNTLTDAQKENWEIFTGCDLALSAKTGADFLVYITVAMDEKGNRQVLDIYRAKGLGYKEQLLKLIETFQRFPTHREILIEDNQFQKVIVDMARDYTDLPVKGHTTTRKKVDLKEGVPSLRVLFENKKITIPYDDKESLDWHYGKTTKDVVDDLLRELSRFTFVGGKVEGKSAHDDTVMALYMVERAIRDWESKTAHVYPIDLF